jgi:hypothetical protein
MLCTFFRPTYVELHHLWLAKLHVITLVPTEAIDYQKNGMYRERWLASS